jgi:outer membrane protein assembly factor BamE
MKLRLILSVSLISLGLLACTPKKVQQGNLLPQSKIERLEVGMSKADVTRIMGTSLLMTPFSEDHWDYAYTTQTGHGPITKKHLELDFEGDTLSRITV